MMGGAGKGTRKELFSDFDTYVSIKIINYGKGHGSRN